MIDSVIFSSLGYGKISFEPIICFSDKTESYSYIVKEKDEWAHYYVINNFVSDDIIIEKTQYGLKIKRIFKNNSARILRLKEIGVKFILFEKHGDLKDDYFYHVENIRVYQNYTFPIDYKRTKNDVTNCEFDVVANNKWADPGVISERIGASPYQPYPAILIGNYKSKKGFIHGTLSQDVFFHNYLVRHDESNVVLTCYSSFKGISYREIQPGEILVDEWYVGFTNDAEKIDSIFAGYNKLLKEKLFSNYGAKQANRYNLLWGSWNDGIFRGISENMLLDEAYAIKENFPNVKYFQLDDGYAYYNKMAHGLGVPYEKNDGIDYMKFPGGLKSYADKVKKIGYVPAIWIGGLCPVETKIYMEHPEWFCDYSYRMTQNMPLDVSIQEVREYMEDALDVLITKYGFNGVKHDFWSYAFEDSHDILKNKNFSGYEYREWWLKAIRKKLPDDGYMESGCDIAMGNPFLGKYFNNYRYGIDVANGNWENMKVNLQWGIACFTTHTGDLFIPNSDAIGLMNGLGDREFMFLVNYVLITSSMVEISGKYSCIKNDNQRLKILKKATCYIKNGDNVYFPDFNYRSNNAVLPSIAYMNRSHFTDNNEKFLPEKTLCLFNVEEKCKNVTLNLNELGINDGAYILTDVWSGEQIELFENMQFNLAPRESRLFSLNKINDFCIYDSNIGMKNCCYENDIFTFECSYGTNAEILCSREVKRVELNEIECDFKFNKKKLYVDIPHRGIIKIKVKGV